MGNSYDRACFKLPAAKVNNQWSTVDSMVPKTSLRLPNALGKADGSPF